MKFLTIPPLDPHSYTGPVRVMSGIARMGAVTLDTPYGEFARWLYVGVSGNVTIVLWDGSTQTILGLGAGVWHPIYTVQINTAGTTATDMLWGS